MVNANYGLSLGAYFGAALNTSDISATDLVPSIFPISIDGKPYALDFNNPMGGNLYRRDSVALLRTQADSARTAGESSVSPEIFWRRSFDSWHLGAGQTHADRETSNPYRFRSSKGMNVWDKGELKALNKVSDITFNSPNESLGVIAVGNKIYAWNGTSVRYKTSIAGSWVTVSTGLPSATPVDMATDGRNLWILYSATGAYRINTSTSPTTVVHHVTMPSGVTATGIWFNKGKLFISDSSSHMHHINLQTSKDIHQYPEIIDLSLFTFNWTASTGVGGYHYFGGYRGDKSVIYKVTLTNEGTALGPAVVAGELPDDELIYHLGSYLGYLIIGTSKGVRFANTDVNGYITIGGLIETGQPVYCTEGQDRFVWFGWGNYDTVSSGLGRMDLAEFTSTLTPAYASDLMAGSPQLSFNSETPIAANPVLGVTKHVVTFENKRIFSVSGEGIFAETDDKVELASLDSGLISHGIIDNKYAAFLDARMEPLETGNIIKLAYAADSGDFDIAGVATQNGIVYTGEFFMGETGRNFEARIIFGDIAGSPLVGSNIVCTGVLLRSYPAPKRVSKFSVPVLLFDTVNVSDRDWSGNPGDDFNFLLGLHKRQLPFTFQEGEVSYTVVMDDYQWLPEKRSNVSGFQGTFVAVLREIL
jgi:hypothetical protein